jgi:hypothetical protein
MKPRGRERSMLWTPFSAPSSSGVIARNIHSTSTEPHFEREKKRHRWVFICKVGSSESDA